jgi:hypothetical protein
MQADYSVVSSLDPSGLLVPSYLDDARWRCERFLLRGFSLENVLATTGLFVTEPLDLLRAAELDKLRPGSRLSSFGL